VLFRSLADEPYARASIEAGADLVLFSGDKLLGGPQAGIIVGRADLVARIDQNPLMRALRVDKLTLASLGATLQLHRDVDQATEQLPIFAMLTASIDSLRQRAQRIIDALAGATGIESLTIEDTTCYLGGGSLPTKGIASLAVRLTPTGSEDELAHRLRSHVPAVVPRVHEGAIWIELRSVFPAQDDTLINTIHAGA